MSSTAVLEGNEAFLLYLKGTQDHALVIKKSPHFDLEGWSGADWGRDLEKRRSWSVVLLTIGGNPILWSSKLQTSVATSTAEAEFFALSDCTRDVKWTRLVLRELSIPVPERTTIHQDILGTIYWTDAVQGLRKIKYVGIR